ncbi:MAG: ATP synthase F0 subunit C [Patescibacteria group bacterium]
MNELAFGLAYALPALGAAMGIGFIGAAALNALGRNPEKLSEIRTLMITAIVFADALAIIGIIVAVIATIIA